MPVLRRGSALTALALGFAAIVASRESAATQAPIDLGEVTASSVGVDVAELRKAALAEIGELDAAKLPRRRVVVSLSLAPLAADGRTAFSVNAALHDAKTGQMLAIIESDSKAPGSGSALRAQVASAAVRSAMRRIPSALGR